jgi:uracil-DNA glycosylase
MKDEKNPLYIPPNDPYRTRFGGKEELGKFFTKRVFTYSSTDIVKGTDCRGGARLRRENLFNYLSSFSKTPDYLLVGEAPGPWGARFSGVPFTGEGPLSRGELPFAGEQTSASEIPYSERAGTVFWDALRTHHANFFVWNALPLHPHKPDEPLSLRTPQWSEVKEHLPLLEELVAILKPQAIAAIGRVAEKALSAIGRECVYVRHPSYGGVKLFQRGMVEFFR